MNENTFRCAKCGGTFIKARSDEEAQAEAEEQFTAEELTETAVICDDCYKKLYVMFP